MHNIRTQAELIQAIMALEVKQKADGEILRQQFHASYESMKPVNILKKTIKEAFSSTEMKDGLLNTSVGVSAGFIVKKLFESVSKGPLTGIAGTTLMMGISSLVARNPETVKAVGNSLIGFFKKHKETTEAQPPEDEA